MALEIFCIASLPMLCPNTHFARKKAHTSPSTLIPMDSANNPAADSLAGAAALSIWPIPIITVPSTLEFINLSSSSQFFSARRYSGCTNLTLPPVLE
jgi:hypothetical protein